MAIRNTFKAYERLKREQHIDTLFRTGKAFSIAPVRVIYLFTHRHEGELSPVRAGFSAPKKKFKKATDRNRIKRVLRESWRLNKHSLYEAIPCDKQLHVFLLYIDDKVPAYDAVYPAVIKAIERLITDISKNV